MCNCECYGVVEKKCYVGEKVQAHPGHWVYQALPVAVAMGNGMTLELTCKDSTMAGLPAVC